MCIHIHIHIHIHVYAHIYIYVDIYTHTHTLKPTMVDGLGPGDANAVAGPQSFLQQVQDTKSLAPKPRPALEP